MKSRIALLLLATLAAIGCASTGGGSPTGPTITKDQLGPFDCVNRTAAASPPPRGVLDLGMVRGDEKKIIRKERDPLLDLRLCGDGQVPVAKNPAKPTVAKGNPLIGPIDLSPSAFFERKEEIGDRIRRSLQPREKVYFIPPGPDEGPHDAPPDPPGCNGVSSFGTCYYYGPASYASTADGGGMTMSIERPGFHGNGHSLDEIAVQGGDGNGNIVELGWNVSTSQYPDENPHLFIFHWINWMPTCYDGCGWQQYSATYFPGMNLGPLVGRDVYIGYVFYQGNWWAWFDNQWLGYFPGSEWGGKYTKSSMIQWFGEVATNNGIPPDVDMGNGLFPTDPSAASNATLCDVDAAAWVCWYRDLQSLGPTYPPYYDIRRTGFGQTRYGGPGH